MTDETLHTELTGSNPDVTDAVATPELTPGALLKAARENAGVSVKKIATDMRVSLTIINALENDHYEKMAAETFVLGYIRTYARCLNLNSDTFIGAYQQYRQQHKLPTQGFGESTRRVEQVLKLNQPIKVHKPGSPWLKLLMWLLVLVVVLLLVFSVFGDKIAQQLGIEKPVIISVPALESSDATVLGAGEQQTIANPLEAVVTAESAAEATAATESAASDAQSVGVVDRTGVAESAAAVKPSVAQTEVVKPEVAPTQEVKPVVSSVANNNVANNNATNKVVNNPSVLSSGDNTVGLDTLVLTFTDECWLEVSDSRGDILTVELYQAGSSLTLQGEAPFDVLMGNVRAVNVMLNGKAVVLRPEGDSKTLRTQIDKL